MMMMYNFWQVVATPGPAFGPFGVHRRRPAYERLVEERRLQQRSHARGRVPWSPEELAVVDLIVAHRQNYGRRPGVTEKAEIEAILADHDLTWDAISERPFLSLQTKIRDMTKKR